VTNADWWARVVQVRTLSFAKTGAPPDKFSLCPRESGSPPSDHDPFHFACTAATSAIVSRTGYLPTVVKGPTGHRG
jgi:hypothetical protein